MQPIIEVKNISKKYNITNQKERYLTLRDSLTTFFTNPFKFLKQDKKEEFWALKDINFEIMKGEVVGIIGRNGAGKSTLLKILSQITPPTTGEIKLHGTVGSLLEVGTGFHPELTGRENIFLNGAILGIKKKEIEKSFNEIVEFAGIEKFLDTPVKYYSSGMYVRLAFSVAAHMNTDILIIDEVLAVGDAEFQKKCLGKMEDITQKEGRTILFVSHNMNSIKLLCQKTIWVNDGKIKIIGNTNSVISQYSHENKEFTDTNTPIVFPLNNQNKEFTFTKIWITNNEGIVTNEIFHDDDFNINLEFDVKIEINTVEISIALKNTNDVNVTFSSLSDSFNGKGYPFKKGSYTTTAKIRGNFLMPDTYTVRISAHERGVRDIDKNENAMKFKIIDRGSSMAPYGDAALHWSCVLNNANWKIKKNE